jgi:hypothetical protein
MGASRMNYMSLKSYENKEMWDAELDRLDDFLKNKATPEQYARWNRHGTVVQAGPGALRVTEEEYQQIKDWVAAHGHPVGTAEGAPDLDEFLVLMQAADMRNRTAADTAKCARRTGERAAARPNRTPPTREIPIIHSST